MTSKCAITALSPHAAGGIEVVVAVLFFVVRTHSGDWQGIGSFEALMFPLHEIHVTTNQKRESSRIVRTAGYLSVVVWELDRWTPSAQVVGTLWRVLICLLTYNSRPEVKKEAPTLQ